MHRRDRAVPRGIALTASTVDVAQPLVRLSDVVVPAAGLLVGGIYAKTDPLGSLGRPCGGHDGAT
jgi:hypothetical protein